MPERATALLLLLIAILSVQLGASVAKGLFPLVGASGTAALRCVIAALFLGALWRPWRGPLSPAARRAIFLYGASLGCMNFVFYLSLARIPLGIAVALEFTGPLAVALISSRRPLDLVWALLAVAGIVGLVPRGEGTSLDPFGVACALGAGFFWALYIVFGKRAGSTAHAGRAAALGLFVASLVTLPMGIATAGTRLVGRDVLPFAIVVAILSSALPYSLEMFALKRLPAKTFGILMSLEPAAGALSGAVILGEKLSLGQWIAIVAIILASVGSTTTAPAEVAV